MSDEKRDLDADQQAAENAERQRQQDTPPAGFMPVRPDPAPEPPDVPAPPDSGPVQIAPEPAAPAEAAAEDSPPDVAAALPGAGLAPVGGPLPVEPGAGGTPLGRIEPAPGGGVMSRPEVVVGVAFVGGFIVAMILRRLGS